MNRGLAVTRNHLYYLHREREGLFALRSLPLTGGKSSLVSLLTKNLDAGLSISPDQKYALYSQVDHEGSTLMLVDEFR